LRLTPPPRSKIQLQYSSFTPSPARHAISSWWMLHRIDLNRVEAANGAKQLPPASKNCNPDAGVHPHGGGGNFERLGQLAGWNPGFSRPSPAEAETPIRQATCA